MRLNPFCCKTNISELFARYAPEKLKNAVSKSVRNKCNLTYPLIIPF